MSVNGELPPIDAKRVIKILATDIGPCVERDAKARGDMSAAWGVIEKECGCNKSAAKLFFKLSRMSEELKDDYLRTLFALMKAGNVGISQDLVDKMQGSDAPSMPTVDSSGGMGADNLVTLHDRQRKEDEAAFDNADAPAAA